MVFNKKDVSTLYLKHYADFEVSKNRIKAQQSGFDSERKSDGTQTKKDNSKELSFLAEHNRL